MKHFYFHLMSGVVLSLSALAIVAIIPVSPAAAVSITNPLSGRILIAVQSHGELWYVSPVNAKRYLLTDADGTFRLLSHQSIEVSDRVLAAIPQPIAGKRMVPNATAKKYLGKILNTPVDASRLWYVDPVSGSRYFLDHSARSFSFFHTLSLGISNKDLDTIAVATY